MKIDGRPSILFLLGSCLLFGACASRIETFDHPTQREAELGQTNQYCWNENEAPTSLEKIQPTGGHNPAFDATVRAAINETLEEKGYHVAPCAKAGFVVDYRMGIHEDVAAVDASQTESMHDYGARWSMGNGQDVHYEGLAKPPEVLITVRHGTLHIVAFTAKGEILWHRSAEKILSEQESDAKRLETVRKATHKTMAGFPDHD